MGSSVKLFTLFVIFVHIISVSTQNIHKSKRILQQPLRVLAPPDLINTSSENKYLSLAATFDIKEDDEVLNKSDEQAYNTDEDEQVPNKSSDQTYYNIEEDEQVPNKSSEQTYNIEEDKQVPSKSSVQTESHGRSLNNEYVNIKTQRTFPKRTEETSTIVPIIENENYVFAYNGDYHYSYKGADGTQAFERGERKPAKDGVADDFVVGGYSYKGQDGKDYSLTYTAGENGYQPVGAHLPTPPPIPPAIQRVLRILATKTTPEPVTESLNSYDYN